jgi:uncharacterized membrane protein
MRTLSDRIRHAAIFEIIALVIVIVAGSWITGHSAASMGMLGLIFSLFVVGWNLLYNWLFDLWEREYRNTTKRGFGMRVWHAVLFEAGILVFGVFLVAWWLGITLLQALVLDIGIAVFFVVYAFIFNWVYDIVFPIPQPVTSIEPALST